MSLNLIKNEDISRKIKKEFSYTFWVEQSGLYAIVVSAKTKSWFQNTTKFISFFRDDNLAIRINGTPFPKLSGERGEFDSEASWNGNKTKGLRQVNLLVAYLEQGEQVFQFVSKGTPLLELIEIYQVSKNQISIDPSKYGIENGDRRPWFKILTQNVGVISVTAKATASLRSGDDNDLQIRINGIREQNNTSRAHKYWFWCGRVLNDQLKVFTRTVSLKPGYNYIEFWADGMPIFNELNVSTTLSDRTPSVGDPLWTGDFYDDSEEMILARLIFGEARNQAEEAKIWVASTVFNRISSPTSDWWPDTVHDVVLQDRQYKSFNDDNRRFIESPLLDLSQKQSWESCYLISQEILNGTILIQPEVTHFHDIRQSQDDFMKMIPDGKFLKRIDNLFFYWSPR